MARTSNQLVNLCSMALALWLVGATIQCLYARSTHRTLLSVVDRIPHRPDAKRCDRCVYTPLNKTISACQECPSICERIAGDPCDSHGVKRALYELPDGAEYILGNIRTTFNCNGLGYGYYADTDNDCKIFHICQSFKMSDGSIYNNHWSFMCGNQTVFNQVSLSCSHPEDAVPCENAKDFYYINDYFGEVRNPSVKDTDLNLANDLITKAYGSRVAN